MAVGYLVRHMLQSVGTGRLPFIFDIITIAAALQLQSVHVRSSGA